MEARTTEQKHFLDGSLGENRAGTGWMGLGFRSDSEAVWFWRISLLFFSSFPLCPLSSPSLLSNFWKRTPG